jgi:hypothetical protein
VSKLDELRARFRIHHAPVYGVDHALGDPLTYGVVNLNGMTPDGQLKALVSGARELGWPAEVSADFVGGHYVLKVLMVGECRLLFTENDNDEVVIAIPSWETYWKNSQKDVVDGD